MARKSKRPAKPIQQGALAKRILEYYTSPPADGSELTRPQGPDELTLSPPC